MNQSSRFTRIVIFLLLAAALLLAVSFGLSSYFGDHAHSGSLMLFDDDLSDSAFAWFVAIPIVIVVLAAAALITIGALMVALVLTVAALVVGLLAAVLSIILAVAPLLILMALPLLALYGLVKLLQRNNRPPALV